MTELIYSIIFFVVAVGVLISFHEYGHYWVARKLGVSVLKFSIGFGPSLFKFNLPKRETEYVIAAIPLGGYVKMLDESVDEVPEDQLPKAFNRQPLYKRSAIVAAGPFFNFLLAGLLYWAVFLIGTEGLRPVVGSVAPNSIAQQAGIVAGDEILQVGGSENKSWRHNQIYVIDRIVNGEILEMVVRDVSGDERAVSLMLSELAERNVSTKSWEQLLGLYPLTPTLAPVIGEVVSDSPADIAGIESGDRIIEVSGEPVDSWRQLVTTVNQSPATPLTLLIERADLHQELIVTPEAVEVEGGTVGRMGVVVAVPSELDTDFSVVVQYGPLESLWLGVQRTWSITALTVTMLGKMLNLSEPSNQLGGPLTIATYAGQAAQAGINTYLTFLALLSISLGILNLLPIPILDGGHLMFHLYEAITGSPPSDEIVQWSYRIGIAMLIGIMSLAFYNDIVNLF